MVVSLLKIQLFSRGACHRVTEAIWMDHGPLPLAGMHSGITTGDFMHMRLSPTHSECEVNWGSSITRCRSCRINAVLTGSQGLEISPEQQFYTMF